MARDPQARVIGEHLLAAAVADLLPAVSAVPHATSTSSALTDLDNFASRIPAAMCTSVFCAIIDRQWLPAAAIAARDGADILIAIGEAAANAFEHSPAGRADGTEPVQITVTARPIGATVEVTVTDTGAWRPPRADTGTRGHGIVVMNALMDVVTISSTEHGTTVTMTKEL